MQNLIDTTLPENVMAEINGLIQQILAKLPFLITQTNKERKRGGWMTSDKALQLMKLALRNGRLHPELLSPQINLDYLERDIKLIEQLKSIEASLMFVATQVNHTHVYLHSEAAGAGLLVYNQLKLAAKAGFGGEEAVAQMKEIMPASGKCQQYFEGS